jgi:hypothetical protein
MNGKERNEHEISISSQVICAGSGEWRFQKDQISGPACEYFIKALEANEIKAEGGGKWSPLNCIAGRRLSAIYWYDIALQRRSEE